MNKGIFILKTSDTSWCVHRAFILQEDAHFQSNAHPAANQNLVLTQTIMYSEFKLYSKFFFIWQVFQSCCEMKLRMMRRMMMVEMRRRLLASQQMLDLTFPGCCKKKPSRGWGGICGRLSSPSLPSSLTWSCPPDGGQRSQRTNWLQISSTSWGGVMPPWGPWGPLQQHGCPAAAAAPEHNTHSSDNSLMSTPSAGNVHTHMGKVKTWNKHRSAPCRLFWCVTVEQMNPFSTVLHWGGSLSSLL